MINFIQIYRWNLEKKKIKKSLFRLQRMKKPDIHRLEQKTVCKSLRIKCLGWRQMTQLNTQSKDKVGKYNNALKRSIFTISR